MKIAEDIKKYNERLIETAIENRKSYKNAKRLMIIGKKQVVALTNENVKITNKEDIINLVTKFYSKLYKAPEILEGNMSTPREINEIPEVLIEEVEKALTSTKNGKATGNDGIMAELLKFAGADTLEIYWLIYTQTV